MTKPSLRVIACADNYNFIRDIAENLQTDFSVTIGGVYSFDEFCFAAEPFPSCCFRKF